MYVFCIFNEQKYSMNQQIYYKHTAPESIVSRLVKRYLIRTDRKNSLLRIFETGNFNRTPAPIHKSLLKLCDVNEVFVQNRPVWTLTPKKNKSKKVIFFSHGGGHMNNIISFHWKMVEYLIKRTGATVIVPDYPLLPECNYKRTYEMVEETYHQLIKDIDAKDLIFLGDSAGGGISLALAQLLRDKNASIQPSQLLLISPELDASKLHEDVPKYEPFDVILTGAIFDTIVPYYVADCPRDHFLVSPGLGNLDQVGKISIFAGTHDILFPYALDLKKRLEKENRAFNFYEYPKMIHVWAAITLMRESRCALRQMAKLINE